MSQYAKPSFCVVDISGYSFTGKSAFFDLLCEFDGFFHHSKEFEFDLLRVRGGILDLKFALVDSWSPIRSSEAIMAFYHLITTIGGNKSTYSRLFRSGAHYDHYFPGFTEISLKFIDSLVCAKWNCEWPYPLYGKSKWHICFTKAMQKIGCMRENQFFLSRMTAEEFYVRTRLYFNELFRGLEKKSYSKILLSNAFEPFAPLQSVALFDHAKSIIVDRDPRDIYLSALMAGRIAGSKVGQAVTGGGVQTFIDRFRIYRSKMDDQNPNIYRTNFESLVLNYDEELLRIRHFLGTENLTHSQKGAYFSPNESDKKYWPMENA
ncbi:hypothetical protein DCO16_01670 [Polynucleobacter antarcticus]|uniref:Sulfotransferase family protein n=1 Tax=Polynucleobacter antarcticus TaxID=1743162 RepID=A0A6M9PIC1_9BURK|nr:hypothetical protein [Polynucleobacter antarcticus]QKM61904.1 hypothetical protein DCO16_01670 [Polynucleobacter antarcticus]